MWRPVPPNREAGPHIVRFANGNQVEHWAVQDQLSMLQQLGFAEAPGQPAGVAR